MNKFLSAITALLLLVSCSKKDKLEYPVPNPVPPPAMKYIDLGNAGIGFNQSYSFDIDGNGSKDFYVSTLLVGSPVEQRDYQTYYFGGSFYSYSPVNANEEMPVLSQGAAIGANSFPGFEWYNASQLLLARRVIPVNGAPFWNGDWIDASHRYIPVSILKNDKYYFGWVELSFDRQNGTVTLHKAAISLEPGLVVKAGY